ncbi:MAG: lipid A deacylase LpxR family protein [Verrucomicrobia bacterium]|nr:lipid A deacylase LpxR family protein [Verrucomicrobiota bacterium]
MKPSWVFYARVLFVFYAASAFSGPVESAGPQVEPTPIQTISSPGALSAVEENVTLSPHGDDRHYTNGLKLAYTTGSLTENSLWNAPVRWLGESTFLFDPPSRETDDRLEWTIVGQSFFTPENHRASNPSLNDRPYAGWLYTGLDFVQDSNARQLTSLEFLGGVVGSWALGRQVQNNVHALLGEQLARGWNHQLSNEFGFTASWERKWRFNHELGNGYSWEIIPDAGGTAGNVLTYAEAGFLVRWGRGLKADWGPEMVRPGYSGTSYFSGDRAGVKFGWDFFLGSQGRAVAHNIFLDGNTLQNSRSVAKEPVVADVIFGAELFSKLGFRFGFSLVARTPEFKSQRGIDSFGSFDGSYAF